MRKFNQWRERVRCNFIGWDYDLLSQCGQASHRQLKVYTIAVLIIMTIWFVIGFAFVERYIGVTHLWGKLLAGAIFSLVVYGIERVIILHMGSSVVYWFRTALAIFMAVLGGFIFDQIVFKNDLEEAIRAKEKEKIVKDFEEQKTEIDKKIIHLRIQTDSLYTMYQERPVVRATRTEWIHAGSDTLGNPIQKPVVVTELVENPIKKQIDFNENLISQYEESSMFYGNTDTINSRLDERIEKKQTAFLEELNASMSVITDGFMSMVFYFVLFAVLLCLELFVVSLKWGKKKNQKKCEYELIVEHQLNAKTMQLQNAWRELSKKYVTETLPNDN